MAETFVYNMDSLVTRDYLDARLETVSAKINGQFKLVYWMLALVIASTVGPQLNALFSG